MRMWRGHQWPGVFLGLGVGDGAVCVCVTVMYQPEEKRGLTPNPFNGFGSQNPVICPPEGEASILRRCGGLYIRILSIQALGFVEGGQTRDHGP